MAQAIRTYKVVIFEGEPDLKRKADSGILELAKDRIILHFGGTNSILYSLIMKVEVEEHFKVGTTIRLTLPAETMSIVIPRVNFGGYMVVVNGPATHELFTELQREWMRAQKPVEQEESTSA